MKNVNVLFFPRSYPCDLSFSISDAQVPIVDYLELLGVTIDNSLNFGKQIGKITEKVGYQLDFLNGLKNTLSISSKMCLYDSYVMSLLTVLRSDIIVMSLISRSWKGLM